MVALKCLMTELFWCSNFRLGDLVLQMIRQEMEGECYVQSAYIVTVSLQPFLEY
jgi:hypothetical protein